MPVKLSCKVDVVSGSIKGASVVGAGDGWLVGITEGSVEGSVDGCDVGCRIG